MSSDVFNSCNLPINDQACISLGHGSGGKLSSNLINEFFLPYLGNEILNKLEDASVVNPNQDNIAVSIDSFVVNPIFFPGGNIGSLSIHGTINDLAVRGAHPLFIAASFIMEEGFLLKDLTKIIQAMQLACSQSNVKLITADTKVVNKGDCDKIFITTCGIGLVTANDIPSVSKAKVNNNILVSGDIGRHGMAIMATREEFELESTIESDSASLYSLINLILTSDIQVNCLRDITRGGLATVLNEIAKASKVGITIDETQIPVQANVAALGEILGIDPMYIACEGRFVAVVDEKAAQDLLAIMHSHPLGINAAIIGKVVDDPDNNVIAKTMIGGSRLVDTLLFDELPRIC